MGVGEKNILKTHLHFHLPHHHHEPEKEIPKGCVAIVVGQEEGEQERFVIPVTYMNHPLFLEPLKGAEEEYGFHQQGPINIPCNVDEFRRVCDVIDKEIKSNHHHHHHQDDQNCHHRVSCFGA